MAKFINRQEEVLQIQLTPYGKHLFSLGKFDPQYYSYYDDDILYDGVFGGLNETQNNIVDRIKSTDRLEIFSNFSGSVRNNQTNSNIDKNSFDSLTTANGKFFRCLGSNSPWSDYAPAWSISVVGDGSLFTETETVTYQSEYSMPTLNTDLDLEYSGSISEVMDGQGNIIPLVYYDMIHEDRLLLDIQELNTIFKMGGNYDVEVFRIPDNQSLSTQNLEFIDPNSDAYSILREQVEDPTTISYLQPDRDLETLFPVINPSFVEYFLEVRVDDEISDIPDFRSGIYSTNRPNDPQQPCE